MDVSPSILGNLRATKPNVPRKNFILYFFRSLSSVPLRITVCVGHSRGERAKNEERKTRKLKKLVYAKISDKTNARGTYRRNSREIRERDIFYERATNVLLLCDWCSAIEPNSKQQIVRSNRSTRYHYIIAAVYSCNYRIFKPGCGCSARSLYPLQNNNNTQL